MNDKALFGIKIACGVMTMLATVGTAFVEFKAPNRLTDVLKEILGKK